MEISFIWSKHVTRKGSFKSPQIQIPSYHQWTSPVIYWLLTNSKGRKSSAVEVLLFLAFGISSLFYKARAKGSFKNMSSACDAARRRSLEEDGWSLELQSLAKFGATPDSSWKRRGLLVFSRMEVPATVCNYVRGWVQCSAKFNMSKMSLISLIDILLSWKLVPGTCSFRVCSWWSCVHHGTAMWRQAAWRCRVSAWRAVGLFWGGLFQFRSGNSRLGHHPGCQLYNRKQQYRWLEVLLCVFFVVVKNPEHRHVSLPALTRFQCFWAPQCSNRAHCWQRYILASRRFLRASLANKPCGAGSIFCYLCVMDHSKIDGSQMDFPKKKVTVSYNAHPQSQEFWPWCTCMCASNMYIPSFEGT